MLMNVKRMLSRCQSMFSIFQAGKFTAMTFALLLPAVNLARGECFCSWLHVYPLISINMAILLDVRVFATQGTPE
jgi:hypothetical protein